MIKAILGFLGKRFSWWAEVCFTVGAEYFSETEQRGIVVDNIIYNKGASDFRRFLLEKEIWKKNWWILGLLLQQDEMDRIDPDEDSKKQDKVLLSNDLLRSMMVYTIENFSEKLKSVFPIKEQNGKKVIFFTWYPARYFITKSFDLLCDKKDLPSAELVEKILNSYLWELFSNQQKVIVMVRNFYNDEVYAVFKNNKDKFNLTDILLLDDVNLSDEDREALKWFAIWFNKKNYFSLEEIDKLVNKWPDFFNPAYPLDGDGVSHSYDKLFFSDDPQKAERKKVEACCEMARWHLENGIDIYSKFEILKSDDVETIKTAYKNLYRKNNPQLDENKEACQDILNMKEVLLCEPAKKIYDEGYSDVQQKQLPTASNPRVKVLLLTY